jgi:hypothetical protein
MPAAVGPRFVLEAGFLILLAVVVGFADLDPWLIVLVMAVGWLLVSLIEYFAWRQLRAVAVGAYEEPVAEEVAPPPPPPPPAPPPAPPAEDETIVSQPPEAPPPAAETGTETEPAPEAGSDEGAGQQRTELGTEEARVPHRLEPLRPRPRRRWILFGPHERRPEADREEGR